MTADEFITERNREWAAEREIRAERGRRGIQKWERLKWTFMVQSNLPQKVFVIQQIRMLSAESERPGGGGSKVGDIEYYFGYYIEGRDGYWHWGRAAPMIPEADLTPLLEKARAEGTIR
jgi:hypothetical protein